MAKVWETYKHYDAVHAYGNLTTRSCQRSVKIEGLENIPKDGAVILAPNHRTALMDPMMILLISKGKIAFGARSDIFKNPKVARILRWLRILPIARERNGLSEVAKNFETFDEIVECLEHDVVYVVPMGLDYEDFFQGQRRTAIRVGEAIEIGETFRTLEAEGKSEAEIYRHLCETLRERILALIDRIPERGHGNKLLRLLGAIISLPLFALCAVGSIFIWLPLLIITSRLKDKAWTQTVRYVMHLIFPLFAAELLSRPGGGLPPRIGPPEDIIKKRRPVAGRRFSP